MVLVTIFKFHVDIINPRVYATFLVVQSLPPYYLLLPSYYFPVIITIILLPYEC